MSRKNKEGFRFDFSDEDIDSFVQYLKENRLTVDKDEAVATIHSHGNDDPRKLREKKLPKDLIIPDDASLAKLFELWEECPEGMSFDPLEYMIEQLEVAHEIYLRNRAAAHSGAVKEYNTSVENTIAARRAETEAKGKRLELDPTQKEFMRFEHSVERYASKALKEAQRGKKNLTDASVQLHLSLDKVRAWVFIFPPQYGGAPVSVEMLRAALEEQGVVYGVDEYRLRKIAELGQYFRFFQIATGVDAIHGQNGDMQELVSRERKMHLQEDAHGNVNYKEMNIFNSVHAGDAICHITLPTKALNGKTVTGEELEGKPGKPVRVPAGPHTRLSEDGTALLATTDGEVVFSDGRYTIQHVLTIPGDVDNATGNIDFSGDVVVKGDVRDGFEVRVGGNLQVCGTAEGAHLSANGDIKLNSGMLGGQRGSINCGGTLHCKYLEHCKVYSKGPVYAETINHAEVACEDEIIITNDRGGIVGGKIIALKKVETKTIGGKNNPALTTQVTIGATPKLRDEAKQLEERRKATERNAKRIELNIRYIESSAEQQSPERIQLLGKLKVQHQMTFLQLAQIDRQLAGINEKLNAPSKECHFTCTHIFPTVVVTIGEQTVSFEQEREGCTLRISGGKLQEIG